MSKLETATDSWVVDPGIEPKFAKRIVAHVLTRKKDAKCKVCKIRLRSAGPRLMVPIAAE